MTFDKTKFKFDGMYLSYRTEQDFDKFVARFKHDPKEHKVFINFLCKHFTPEEYFKAYHAGCTPDQILESRGYVTGNVRRFCKQRGVKNPKPHDVLDVLAEVNGYSNNALASAVMRLEARMQEVEDAIAA